MIEKITAIVLDITRHNDKLDIVNLYTRSRGRVSFLSPAAGKGKSGRMRQARLQPLAIIDADISFRGNTELQRLGSFSLHTVWRDIYFNPVKQMMALFLSEFLNKLLRASMPDENTWDFICSSLSLLDNMDRGTSDFHIAFLSSLLPFAGIQPDHRTYRDGFVFDMQSGTFKDPRFLRPAPTALILSGEEARLAALLCRATFSNIRGLRLDGKTRFSILNRLLQYYSIHFPGAGNLKSLDIIHEVFH